MSSKALTDAERATLNLILEDFRYLFGKEEILQDEIDNVLQNIKSEEVKSYIQNLRYGSKPETALRESFIAGKSILLKYLFGEGIPEVRSDGFIDYLLKDEMGRGIALELKPLFEAAVKLDKAGKPILEKLKQTKIVPENYAEQILKYIREGEAHFVILTNLKEWFFYSKVLSPKEVKYFCAISFFDFIKEYEVIGNLRDYLERKEFESIRYELDKWFLQSLKTWVGKLSETEFIVDDKRKLELIIELINKFIFVQTLDDYGVIEFNWIRKRWNYQEQMWQRKGKLMVLEKFFDEVDNWFYQYYDTELFREKILQHVKKDGENIEKLYKNLQLILGLTYLQVPFGALKGIMQYNFRYIDEDVLGKAYETFFGEVRKEEGVYYTPKYITHYIAENTVGKAFDEVLAKIREKMEKDEFKDVKELVLRFTSIRVLDPSCGSGSFLIKAIRIIVNKYRELNRLIEDHIKKYSSYKGSLDLPQESRVKTELLSEIKEIVGPSSDRELIARILVRHIHGVDLDKRALEVAKVNIWLEAIKLSPKEFRYDKLPAYTNYILPNLEMNLCNGDSVVGLPEELTITYLSEKHQADIIRLHGLRHRYLENPVDPQRVEEIAEIKHEMRKKLDKEFVNYLTAKGLPTSVINDTKPFHWALEFWYLYYEESGVPLSKDQRGADVVIGNPPYVRIQIMSEKSPVYVDFLNINFTTAFRNYDLALIFIEKGWSITKKEGLFGYIVTNKWMQSDYGEKLRKLLLDDQCIDMIVNFGDQLVFDEASTYTMLLFLNRKRLTKFKYCHIKSLSKNITQLRLLNQKDELDDTDVVITVLPLDKVSEAPWVFAFGTEGKIVEKMSEMPKLKDITRKIFQGIRTSADEVYILKKLGAPKDGIVNVYSKSFDKPCSLEVDILKPLLKGYQIDRYASPICTRYILFPYKIVNGKAFLLSPEEISGKYPLAWKYFIHNKEKLENRERGKWKGSPNWYAFGRRQNIEQFDEPKVMTCDLADEATYMLDKQGQYYFTFAYGIKIRRELESKISYEYLTGILNSKLLDYFIRKVSTMMRGGYYVFRRQFVEKLPIYLASVEEQKPVVDLVKRVMDLNECRAKLIELFQEWSARMKNAELSLYHILKEDLVSIRQGLFNNVWTVKVTFYPNDHDPRCDSVHHSFRIRSDRNKIAIVGMDKNSIEDLIFEMEFDKEELTQHICLSLVQTLESRVEINTLCQLFDKTKVPVIKEVNRNPSELTPNILKKVKEELQKWLGQKGTIGVDADILKIDNEIENLEAQIDALVFKLYKLNEDEIKVVFNSLKTPNLHQAKVLEFFRKL